MNLSKIANLLAVAQMQPVPANVCRNLQQMLGYIAEARQCGMKMVVFPELCVSGYMLGDQWEIDAFIRDIELANEKIRQASEGMVIVWGSVKADWDTIGEDGRARKFNAAFIACDGKWVSNGILEGYIPKTNLPKYRIFDDARHFYPAGKLAIERGLSLDELLRPFHVTVDTGNGLEELVLALTACEDLWEDEYSDKPSVIYGEGGGVDLLVDISCSPWTEGKWRARERMLQKRIQDSGCPILYVNTVGLQNNAKNLIWFDGESLLIDQSGVFRWRAPQHEPGLFKVDIASFLEGSVGDRPERIAELSAALIHAMRKFYEPFPMVIVGLSGGVDSAVMLGLLVKAIGAEKILAVNMPTKHNSETTQCLARECATFFGVKYRVVSIQGLYDAELQELIGAGFVDSKDVFAEPSPSLEIRLLKENIQARLRGRLLASIAAALGGVFTCNGNKTEVALNYFTLYGDGAGATAFLGDVLKGDVYALAETLHIPRGIIDVIPSAELSPEQSVDAGKGDPIHYPYHDWLVAAFVEKRWDPTDVLKKLQAGTLERELGCSSGTISHYFPTVVEFMENLEWAWHQYSIEFKRHQLPPVFITSRRAFGFDRRGVIVNGEYFSEEYYCLREGLLCKLLIS